ncbi:MAG: cation-translocating P-type ATPase [Phycisphaerae bacterium]
MAHDYLKKSIESQTGRASTALVIAMMGGVLVVNSFFAQWMFTQPGDDPSILNPHAAILALAGAILLGAPIVGHAVKHIWLGHSHMDALVALGILAALAIGKYQEAGVISFFVVIGNLIETRTALGARAAIESLIRLAPKNACRLMEGREEQVDIADLRPGDIIRIRPGDNIPADGKIVNGETTVNQASITGESLPVEKGIGDQAFAGTLNLTGAIDVRVTKAGEDTTLGKVQKLILQAEATRTPIMRIIDRYAGWYTPTILMLSALVLFFTGEIERSIAMLVVACPCALVLATPTAMVAAVSCAARLGVLVKNVTNLESARHLTAVVFDKTGTLTTGRLAVTCMKPAPGIDGLNLLRLAASAEQLSRHPVARAITEMADRARVRLEEPDRFEEIAGRGVTASINGDSILVGRSTWLRELGTDMGILSDPEFQEPDGISALHVARNGRCIGWVGLEDCTRPEARRAIDELRNLGIRVLAMVTGDRWSVARRVGHEMGCTDVQAEVLPDEKLTFVASLKQAGHRVAVVGDGVNDAPALAAGDLGIAMGAAGSDVAINSASIALMNNDLSRLPFLIGLSWATARVIWQNVGFGITYIVALELLAALGHLPAMLAAVLHTSASVMVIFNSARLVRSGEHLQAHAVAPPPAGTQHSPPRRPAANGAGHEGSTASPGSSAGGGGVTCRLRPVPPCRHLLTIGARAGDRTMEHTR